MSEPTDTLDGELPSDAAVLDSGWGAERVQEIARRLSTHRDRMAPPVSVTWLPRAVCFSSPDGRITLSRQLLSRGLSDQGLAFVLAHELAHHDLGHFALLPRRSDSARWSTETLGAIADAALRQTLEQDADQLALSLCLRAGFEPCGAEEALELLEQDAVGEGDERTATDLALRRLALTSPDAGEPVVDVGVTELWFACVGCALRFAPSAHCPSCGGDDVCDLRDEAARRRLLGLLAERAIRPLRRHFPAWVPVTLVLGAGLAFSAHLLAGGEDLKDALAGGVIVVSVIGLGVLLVGGIARDVLDHRVPLVVAARLARWAVWRRVGGAREQVVRGHVRALRTVVAPLSGVRCALYRVAGEGPSGWLDDAEVGGFEVVAGGVVLARVEGHRLYVGLPVGPARAAVVAGHLREVLRCRGTTPEGEVVLAEAFLRDGDEVEVRGLPHAEVVTDGLRLSRELPVFRDGTLITRPATN